MENIVKSFFAGGADRPDTNVMLDKWRELIADCLAEIEGDYPCGECYNIGTVESGLPEQKEGKI